MALRPLSANSAFTGGVASGPVVGISAATTPTGLAIFTEPALGRLLDDPDRAHAAHVGQHAGDPFADLDDLVRVVAEAALVDGRAWPAPRRARCGTPPRRPPCTSVDLLLGVVLDRACAARARASTAATLRFDRLGVRHGQQCREGPLFTDGTAGRTSARTSARQTSLSLRAATHASTMDLSTASLVTRRWRELIDRAEAGQITEALWNVAPGRTTTASSTPSSSAAGPAAASARRTCGPAAAGRWSSTSGRSSAARARTRPASRTTCSPSAPRSSTWPGGCPAGCGSRSSTTSRPAILDSSSCSRRAGAAPTRS